VINPADGELMVWALGQEANKKRNKEKKGASTERGRKWEID